MAEGFTIVAWSQSVDTANVLTAQTAVADPHVRVVLNDIVVPNDFHFLWGAYALGAFLTRAQLSSPSLRRIFLPEITPVDVAALPTSPQALFLRPDDPIQLDAAEALDANMSENGAAAQRQTLIAFLAAGPRKIDDRPSFTVRVTNTTTLVAFAWTSGALTFDQSLPAGKYAVTGGRMRSAGLLAWRLVFVGGTYRPGAIGYVNVQQIEHPAFRDGNLGVWGEFNHNTPPTVDFLSATADTSQAGELDLVYEGAGAV